MHFGSDEFLINFGEFSAGLYVHRGLLTLQWKGDIEAALKLLEKAIEVDDKCEFAYETLGTVEVQRGKIENFPQSQHFFMNFKKCPSVFIKFSSSFYY